MDLPDLRKKRKPFSKFAYQSRVKSVLNSAAAQKVAVNYAKRLRKTCKEVVKRKEPAGDAWELSLWLWFSSPAMACSTDCF